MPLVQQAAEPPAEWPALYAGTGYGDGADLLYYLDRQSASSGDIRPASGSY